MYAFIHIPKTAGSTISSVLRHSFCSRHCDVRVGNDFLVPRGLTAAILTRTQRIYWRLESIQGHSVVPYTDLETIYPNIRYYTYLRDPIVRCASEYQFCVQRGGSTDSFDRWIRQGHRRNRQTNKLTPTGTADAAIEMLTQRVGFVGLTEHFDESLVMLQRWFSDPRFDIRYKSKNVAKDNSIRDCLLGDPSSLDLLSEANQEDCQVYEYAVRELYTRQVRAYGDTLDDDVRQFKASNTRPWPYPKQLPSLLLREFVYKPLAYRLAG